LSTTVSRILEVELAHPWQDIADSMNAVQSQLTAISSAGSGVAAMLQAHRETQEVLSNSVAGILQTQTDMLAAISHSAMAPMDNLLSSMRASFSGLALAPLFDLGSIAPLWSGLSTLGSPLPAALPPITRERSSDTMTQVAQKDWTARAGLQERPTQTEQHDDAAKASPSPLAYAPALLRKLSQERTDLKCPTTGIRLAEGGILGVYLFCKSCKKEHCIPWHRLEQLRNLDGCAEEI
jgi:hypothetical protein